MSPPEKPSGVVKGTLDMLILKVLALEPMHGYGVGTRLTQITKGVFQINAGSLFPALARLERDGLIEGEWQASENNRRAKYYSLTRRGRSALEAHTEEWRSQADAIARVLKARPGEV
jgi:PadR family transcriptional regulator, regulatory protein PadR